MNVLVYCFLYRIWFFSQNSSIPAYFQKKQRYLQKQVLCSVRSFTVRNDPNSTLRGFCQDSKRGCKQEIFWFRSASFSSPAKFVTIWGYRPIKCRLILIKTLEGVKNEIKFETSKMHTCILYQRQNNSCGVTKNESRTKN